MEGQKLVRAYCFQSKDDLKAYIVEEVINTSEAIEILGCTRQNLNDLIKRGKIVPIKDLPRDRLFFKSDILQRKKQ